MSSRRTERKEAGPVDDERRMEILWERMGWFETWMLLLDAIVSSRVGEVILVLVVAAAAAAVVLVSSTVVVVHIGRFDLDFCIWIVESDFDFEIDLLDVIVIR